MGKNVEKILFYRLSDRYIDFLRSHDTGVQQNAGNRLRPYVGILFELNGRKYDDPSKDPVSVIKFNCMIPAPESEMTYVDFSTYDHDPKYRALIEAEYHYIKSNRSDILEGARKFYALANKPNTYFERTSCKFKLLEGIYRSFKP